MICFHIKRLKAARVVPAGAKTDPRDEHPRVRSVYTEAGRVEKHMTAALRASLERWRSSVTFGDLLRMVQRADPEEIFEAYKGSIGAVAINLQREAEAAMTSSAAAASKELGDAIPVLDLGRPQIKAWLSQHTAELVQGLEQQERTKLREVLAHGVMQGRHPRRLAEDVQRVIGLDARQARAVRNLQDTMIAKGKPAAKVTRAADRYADRLLKQRAQRIAHTESMDAVNRGRLALWQQLQTDGALEDGTEHEWLTGRDDAVCQLCVPLHEQRRRIGESFSSGRWSVAVPPLHPRCRCTTAIVIPDDEPLSASSPAPDTEEQPSRPDGAALPELESLSYPRDVRRYSDDARAPGTALMDAGQAVDLKPAVYQAREAAGRMQSLAVEARRRGLDDALQDALQTEAARLKAHAGALETARPFFVPQMSPGARRTAEKWKPVAASGLERFPACVKTGLAERRVGMIVLKPDPGEWGHFDPRKNRIVVRTGSEVLRTSVHEIAHALDWHVYRGDTRPTSEGYGFSALMAKLPSEFVSLDAMRGPREQLAEAVCMHLSGDENLAKTAPQRAEFVKTVFRDEATTRKATATVAQWNHGLLTDDEALQRLKEL